ncbi:hypothetical protein QS306_13865 [Paraburkholderia bonniea]|uniref:hypothetical protein n=1 Tax=Paraburkholderia bonniea TaxID=2152891 RepID=UPI001291CD3C|nr:hypothetical protein [Paraburkholderia bonniea]WJF91860.1 hypothetical protein QS306_13865 [Paraburkholderia bonniea]WJF95179.1 hypothetical protein QS308_13875 [Paraburkholderia bonniea]
MNLQEQIGALEAGVAQLIDAVAAPSTGSAAEQPPATATPATAPAVANSKPTLQIARPSQNQITMTVGDHTVSLHPEQLDQLLDELASARASMQPEVPMSLPAGWRFAATRNPVMATQKQSNGDRMLIMRHSGHGWVPFSFSPDQVIQMYMLLTQR